MSDVAREGMSGANCPAATYGELAETTKHLTHREFEATLSASYRALRHEPIEHDKEQSA
jgi:hypothetical protein